MNAPARIFTAIEAVRERVPFLMGIISPSGGGKTYSALRLATGIQQVVGGDICVLDTENRRALHYADRFKFIHVPFEAPFGSLDYLQALRFCATKKPCVTIVDSMTHEHVGEGGYLETAEQTVSRIAGDDYKKREAAKFAGWAKAGPLRTKMIEGVKQLDGNFIFCWRAKQKTKPMKVSGKFEPVEMGLMPIAGEEWVYEMVVNCMLPARSGGVPLWRADHVGERLMMKLPEQFKDVFAESQPLSEDIGRKLAEWAQGGQPISPPVSAKPPAPSTQTAPSVANGGAGATDSEEMAWPDYCDRWALILGDSTHPNAILRLWNSDEHKAMRRRIGASPEQVKALVAKVSDRVAELKATA